MTAFSGLAIGGIAIIAIIMGLVQFAKKFGLDGNWLILLALLLGFFFGGIAYGIDQALIPGGWVPYIQWVVFALAVGLSAAGFYDLGKTRFGTNMPGKDKFGTDIK